MTQVEELVESARGALESGNRLTARGYLRRASRLAPDRLDIWQALLDVTDLPADRLRCLERIVDLAPDDGKAAQALEALRAEIAAAEAQAEDDPVQDAAGDLGAQATDPGVTVPVPAPVLVDVRQDITEEMRREWDEALAAGQPLYCIDHPQRQTNLRCNRCGAPVCTSCIVRTPVGFRCKECIRAQQASFFNARWYDYPIALALSLALSVPAAAITNRAGWWFAMIISPIAGGLIGGIVHRAVGKRRGRWTWLFAGAGIIAGALTVLGTITLLGRFDLVSTGIYAAMATGAAIGVLRLGRR